MTALVRSINSFLIQGKLNDPNSPFVDMAAQQVRKLLTKAGCTEITYDQYLGIVAAGDTLIVAIGGDGTMMHAMRLALHRGSFVYGINCGNVGFLTNITPRDPSQKRGEIDETMLTEMLLKDWVNSEFMVEHRTVGWVGISPNQCRVGANKIAVNEVSVASEQSGRMIEYDLAIGDMNAGSHRANAVMISTPSGSTAYSLAAGGAIMLPTAESFQIVPVAPAVLTSRPIIYSAETPTTITVKGTPDHPIIVQVDGQTAGTFKEPVSVQMTALKVRVKVIRNGNSHFFNSLSHRLGWINK